MKKLSEWSHGTLDKKLLEKCRDIVAGIEPEAEVFLYGSRARGEAGPDSDYAYQKTGRSNQFCSL